jgi:hypothetical protein
MLVASLTRLIAERLKVYATLRDRSTPGLSVDSLLQMSVLRSQNEPSCHVQPLYNRTSQRTASKKSPSAIEVDC